MAKPPKKSDPTPAPSAEDEVLIREIDEAVRQDDAAQFMKRYGAALAVIIVIFLAGFGGWLYWQSREEAALEAQSETLVTALDALEAGDYAEADASVDPLIDEGTVGARAAGLFLQAASALEQGETQRAVETYAMIAADGEIPAALRDLARLREVASNFDERDAEEVIAKLEPLAREGSAFYGSAAELTAIAHLEMGNREEAGQIFADIAKNDELPESLQRRAQQLAGILGVDAIEDVEQLLRDQGALPPEDEAAAADAAQ